jgi:Ran GTPase-activating protein (RanGAP) involved in mRNA processing and transport
MTEMQPPHLLCLLSGIIAIANAIPDMGALASLDISSCKLTRGARKAKYRSKTDEKDRYYETDASGVTAVAGAMRALTSLNLSGNELGVEGAKHLAAGIKASKCVGAVVLAPFPCPSDHWLNCCCLLLSTG